MTQRVEAKRPRIGIDAHVLTGKYQGSRTWLVELLPRIAWLRPDFDFIVYSFAPEEARRIVDGTNVEHHALTSRSAIRRLLFDWRKAQKREQLDALVVQYIAPPLFAGRLMVVVHDILFETHPHFFPFAMRLRNRLFVRRSACRADAVVTVSAYSKAAIAERYAIAPSRIHIVPNGASNIASGALPDRVPCGSRFALFVGRLEPRKNLEGLLAAFARLDDPAIRLVVVGRDDFEQPRTLEAMRRDTRVIHLADVPAGELAALYANAVVTVFPSLGEGFGIPILESLVQSTPVIASSTTAMPEIGGAAVSYFDPMLPDAESRLSVLIGDAFSGRLTFDGSATAARLRLFDWDRSAKRLAAALDVLLIQP